MLVLERRSPNSGWAEKGSKTHPTPRWVELYPVRGGARVATDHLGLFWWLKSR